MLDPLIFMLIYYILVVVIMQRGDNDYLVFVFLALLPWRWFTSSVNEGVVSIKNRSKLIKQIYFPKVVLPIISIASNTVSFIIAFGLLILLLLILTITGFKIGLAVLFLPFIIIVQLLFTIGITIILSHLNVFYADVENLVKYLLRIWFFLSPGIYSITMIPDKYLPIFRLNPFTLLFESYRDSVIRNIIPNLSGLLILGIISIILIGIGLNLVHKNQGIYAKVL
ncbi:ABC transporter permease [Candidatus Woesearchaeota archaeon]|nr:ABC transporter permease [Candidatus Woesearchaeota archaeon]